MNLKILNGKNLHGKTLEGGVGGHRSLVFHSHSISCGTFTFFTNFSIRGVVNLIKALKRRFNIGIKIPKIWFPKS